MALKERRTGLWTLFASEKAARLQFRQWMSDALFGRGENLKSDAAAAWFRRMKIERKTAASLFIFHFTAKSAELALRLSDPASFL
jgi:hypothetical protein